ncbi:MAG: primosomal protein N' [Bacteroidota bacterium]|nr:primosomal protein N' [Bacteroidota bacterium]
MNAAIFADVILPLPLPGLFTYQVPQELEEGIAPGKRVIVQFGARKFYTAIVSKVHHDKPDNYEVKQVISVLDAEPVVNPFQFELWNWIASYYLCTPGEIYKAALPSGLKLESETIVLPNEEFTDDSLLNSKETSLLELLWNHKSLSIQDIIRLSGRKDAAVTVKQLLDKKAAVVEEKLRSGYKPKFETYIKLADTWDNEEKLQQLLDTMKRSPRQIDVIARYVELSDLFINNPPKEVNKTKLLKDIPSGDTALKALIKKKIFLSDEKQTGRLDFSESESLSRSPLNHPQEEAFKEIQAGFENKEVVLLDGVTSSGKTEIYIHLIEEQLEKDKQVLYLLPEIALTTQIINRLKGAFGNKVGIYHSKFNDAERVETWKNLLNPSENNSYKVILGVRSSVFLPFSNLGLIIVDEEHENSYKQFDPAPRYNARDTAIVMARIHGARVLLGTATPSIESYFNAQAGKYGLVKLSERYQNIQLPEILIADILQARKRRQMKSMFTPLLLDSITETLQNKEQVILFQNRRGFSPYLQCPSCGWIPRCKNCDVSLTYHKGINQLVCHYCGYTIHIPEKCGQCGNAELKTMGFGTEKIEEEMAIFFPDAKIARLDTDTTRTRNAYEKIIAGFESGSINILIGTQMVSKGLDFDNVAVVGILNADNLLNFPDFRAFERSYQLMVQVSGRAGRKNKQGKVIIQTTDPKHTIILDVIRNNFTHMFQSQLAERKTFRYPPFYRLIQITLKHKTMEILYPASIDLAENLKKTFGGRVVGPQPPLVNKVQNWYLMTILLKIEKESSSAKAKQILLGYIDTLKKTDRYKSLQVQLDVDPM